MTPKTSSYTLVILHGWGQSSTSWEQFGSSFAHKNTFCPDLPGFGEEPLVGDAWGVPEYADWVVGQIEKEKLSHVILLGHSFGGRIASLIASQRPKWLKSLILYGAPSLYRPSLKIRTIKKLSPLTKMLPIRAPFNPNPEREDADNKGLGKIFRKVVAFDQSDKLPMIQVPTMLVWGENDTEVPLHIAEEMHKLIPTSTLTVLENLGHNAHVENPPLFYGTITSFISNL